VTIENFRFTGAINLRLLSKLRICLAALASVQSIAAASGNFSYNFTEAYPQIEDLVAIKFQDENAVSSSSMMTHSGFSLTESKMNQRGALWHAQAFDSNLSFTTSFDFVMDRLGGITAEDGGDGVALVFQSVGVHAIGSNNGGIGYMGIKDSLAIELDTWNNQPYSDPNGNHVAIMSRADQFNSVEHHLAEIASRKIVRPLNDGRIQNLTVTYSNPIMKVYLNQNLVLAAAVDLTMIVKKQFWIGLTSATGGSTERHIIKNWKFSQFEN
jgi:hypothetical protein